MLKDDWRTVLRVIGLRLAESGAFYIIVTYLISYITSQGIAERQLALTGLIVATGIGTFTTVLFGAWSDRIGRKKVYLIGCLLVVGFSFVLFPLVNTAVPFLIVLVYIVGLSIIHDMLAGTQGAYFSELFATNTRTSGASLGYQLSAAISGFIPFIATALAVALGWGGVAIVYGLMGVIGLVALAFTRETWGETEKAEVDRIIAGR